MNTTITGKEALYIRRDQLTEDIRILVSRLQNAAIRREESLMVEIANDLADCVEEKKLIMSELIRLGRKNN